ncbi:MAG: discoidin domain-containing protein, partial [Muribaculaceae bacterium]|nr:discoidin domain-containing protein [Muribaculaceae bacterium]
GWDWMPYVPGRLAGITGNVYIRVSEDIIIEDPWVRSALPSLDKAELSVQTNLKNASDKNINVTLSGKITPGNISFSKEVTVEAGKSVTVSFSKDDYAQLVVNDPKLWWPAGYGDQNLYNCHFSCVVDGKVSDERDVKFGIREYSYQTFKNSGGYDVLTFYVNGQKVYLKGGNWGISEYLLRCHGDEYEKKIKLHRDMNYNMIRLWTGCVTDDEFYDYCDKYGIMVWDDFWYLSTFFGVDQPDAFKSNALDKVRRLRNHASIALWCGANETYPADDLNAYLKKIVAEEDGNDRMYQACSNKDGLSGSGWWSYITPKSYFESPTNAMAFEGFPFSSTCGYGLRSEIGVGTFPAFESVKLFIPEEQWWPLPSDDVLANEANTVWNHHFFGREASNASPANYKNSINSQYGQSSSLEEFCEKAQLLNLEAMKGMYEAWNDKMWNDASGLLVWMSNPAYPAFVWQTYDYYYDATGSYWGAKKACEDWHIQWNSSSNSVKVINSCGKDLSGAIAKMQVYSLSGKLLDDMTQTKVVSVPAVSTVEAFKLTFNKDNLALGKQAYASSEFDGNVATKATDGNSSTRWESEYSNPQWMYVDLGEKKSVGTVILRWEGAHASKYDIQVSSDANSWNTVLTNNNCGGGVEELKFDAVEARYVRIYCSEKATMWGDSLYEIEIYSPSDSSDDGETTSMRFVRLTLLSSSGEVLSENTYWTNCAKDYVYTELNTIPEADVTAQIVDKSQINYGRVKISLKNNSSTVAFALRLRMVNPVTGERILPLLLTDNYITLMPGESRIIDAEADPRMLVDGADLLVKQYGHTETDAADVPKADPAGVDEVTVERRGDGFVCYGDAGRVVVSLVDDSMLGADYRVVSVTGAVIAAGRIGDKSMSINVPQGMCIVMIVNDGAVSTKKVIVK